MPELAEVHYFCRRWEPGLRHKVTDVLVHAGKRVFKEGADTRVTEALTGRTLDSAQTHGKQMLFGFTGGAWLGVHLGMSGELRCEPADYAPQKHDHLVLRQAGRTLVFEDPRMFGAITLEETPSAKQPPEWWTNLPPRVQDDAFTVDLLGQISKRRAKTPLKSLLLIQEHFPGIGNWMADEVLWQARLPPTQAPGDLTGPELQRLHAALRHVCELSLETIGKDWSDPPVTWLFGVRWKDGGDCPQTGKPLRRDQVGGRTTCWSPAWQNRPKRWSGTSYE